MDTGRIPVRIVNPPEGYWPGWPKDTPVGYVRHVGSGELEFRQAGHPANDRHLHVEWKPVYVKVDDR